MKLAYGVWLIAYGSYVPAICHRLSAICEAHEIFLSNLQERVSALRAVVQKEGISHAEKHRPLD